MLPHIAATCQCCIVHNMSLLTVSFGERTWFLKKGTVYLFGSHVVVAPQSIVGGSTLMRCAFLWRVLQALPRLPTLTPP